MDYFFDCMTVAENTSLKACFLLFEQYCVKNSFEVGYQWFCVIRLKVLILAEVRKLGIQNADYGSWDLFSEIYIKIQLTFVVATVFLKQIFLPTFFKKVGGGFRGE